MAIWRTIHQLIGASLNYWSKPNFCQMRVDTLISNLPNERWDKEYHISSLDRSVCVFVCLTVTDSEALSSFLLKASHWTSSCIQYLTPHFSHVPLLNYQINGVKESIMTCQGNDKLDKCRTREILKRDNRHGIRRKEWDEVKKRG